MPGVKRPNSEVIGQEAAAAQARSADSLSSEAMLKENICDLCQGPCSIIYLPKCGHRFHTRCVSQYPVKSCPSCKVDTEKVALIHPVSNEEPVLRNGKWTPEEELYVQCVIKEFLAGCLPVGQGTPVRLVLARLLNCSPMRLSKKFQRKALGKHTYNIPKSRTITFPHEQHVERMRTLSKLETQFYHQVVLIKKAEAKGDDDRDELKALIQAATGFWTTQFVKFSMKIGQSILGYDLPPAKKIRRTKRPNLLEIPSNNKVVAPVTSSAKVKSEPATTPTSTVSHQQPSTSPTGTASAGISTAAFEQLKLSDSALLSDDVSLDPFLSINLMDNMWLRSFEDTSSEPSSPANTDDYEPQNMYASAAAMFGDLGYFLFDPVDEPIPFVNKPVHDSVSIDF